METNKENIRKGKVLTKIPVPLKPLPILPRHLIDRKNNKEQNITSRQPLKPINSQAGPSHPKGKSIQNRLNTPLRIDGKFVTHRKRLVDLDWDFKVFKDGDLNNSDVICISDDEENEESLKEKKNPDEANNQCFLDNGATTPGKTCLEPIRVKNIKRSFKRPHSRELQGLSSVPNKHKNVDERVRRKLFVDRFTDGLQPLDYVSQMYIARLEQDYTSEIFEYLIKTERTPAVPRIHHNTRACLINWLIKVNTADGNPATVQLASWYFDSVLAIGSVELDKLQLVAAACFWIAQKLQGPPISAKKLVKCANHAFTPSQLFAAEKIILQKLKFPVQPVVTHNYISYLSWWCDSKNPGTIEVAATFLSMSGLMINKVLCDEYPSVIAVAAVEHALIYLYKTDLLLRLQSCPLYILAKKKSSNVSNISSVFETAVKIVGSAVYEYKAPLEVYGVPPHYIAYKVLQNMHNMF